MLRLRVITAVLLLAVLLPVLAADSLLPLVALGGLMVACGGWEWGRLNGQTSLSAALGGAGSALLALGLAVAGLGWTLADLHPRPAPAPPLAVPPLLWWAATAAWVLGLARALAGGIPAWPRLPQGLRLLLGMPVLWGAWLALMQGRALGLNFLLSVLALVWVADIAAYFGGRRFGRRKLAPALSPGKSWEGVWSGALGVALMAALWIAADRALAPASPSLYSLLLDRHGPLVLLAAVGLLTALSVAGDLFESLVKRSAGAKDASQLLPGHGGVLDRIDALLPVLPVAMALAAVSGPLGA